jgi:hypothetical protein
VVAKVTDVVGFYLAPPENAVVLCIDEKSQIQALDCDRADAGDAARHARAAHSRLCPPSHHHPVRRVEHRHRQGHCDLQPRHRHPEFLRFLRQVARAYPQGQLQLVMDNYAAHKRVEIRDWLTANPRVHVHFTPTSASWMNLVEVWFGIIETPGHPPRHLP